MLRSCVYLEASGWEIGFKVEAVDKANVSLICVATVTNVLEGRVLIHFDGWELDYDYWVEEPGSSPYVHPVGWCEKNRFELNTPKGKKEGERWGKTGGRHCGDMG